MWSISCRGQPLKPQHLRHEENEEKMSFSSVLLCLSAVLTKVALEPTVPLLCIYFRGCKNKSMPESNAGITREIFIFFKNKIFSAELCGEKIHCVWWFSKGSCYLWAGIKHLSDPSTCSSFAADKFISDIKRLFFLLKLLRFFPHFLCFWRKFLKDSYLFFKYSMEFTREIISLWLFLI